jgi:hypothetical protein
MDSFQRPIIIPANQIVNHPSNAYDKPDNHASHHFEPANLSSCNHVSALSRESAVERLLL